MNNKEREFLEKYSLDNKKFEELLSGPDSPQKVEAYFKEFADDVFSQLMADLAVFKNLPKRSDDQKKAISKLKQDFIRQRQEEVKDEEAKKAEPVKSTKVDSLKKTEPELVDHVSANVLKPKKNTRKPKPIKVKPKKVYAVKSKSEPKKEPVSEQPKISVSDKKTATPLIENIVKFFNKFKPKVRRVSKKIKTKKVDTEALKKREGDLKDLHDSSKKGTTY